MQAFLITSKYIPRTIRVMILVMLFQSFSPIAFALTSEPNKDGRFSMFCTMQGYKQVWIASSNNQEKESVELATLNCPYCLLNIGEFDDIILDKEYHIDLVNTFMGSLLTSQSEFHSKVLLKSLPIRAPPYFG